MNIRERIAPLTKQPAPLSMIRSTLLIYALFFTPLIAHSQGSSLNVPFSLGRGWTAFENNCSTCHGVQGSGSEKGPPLIHPYYVPSHHSDESILRAIMSGTRQHHWGFGDMPPVSGISEPEARQIILYIRWLQMEKGLISN